MSQDNRSTRAIRESIDALIARRGWGGAVLPIGSDRAALTYLAGLPVRIEGPSEAVAVIVPGRPSVLIVDRQLRWSAGTGDLVALSADSVGAELLLHLDNGPIGLLGPDRSGSIGAILATAGIDLVDAGDELDVLRAIKHAHEIVDVEHAAHLADRCFEWLLADLVPGRTEAQIAGRISEIGLSMGAADVAVTMHHLVPGRPPRVSSDPPALRTTPLGALLLCTISLAGPRGHRVVLSRPIALGGLDEPTERAARGAGSALAAVARRTGPGTTLAQLVEAATAAALDEGAELESTSITGIGMASIELPTSPDDVLQAGHVLAVSCSCSADGVAVAVQADTLVVEDRVARRLAATAIGVFGPEFHRTPRIQRSDHGNAEAD